MNYFQKLRQRAIEFWQSRSKAQKIKFIISSIATILVLGLMLYLLGRPKYVPLYSNLDMQDAGEIIRKFDDNKIPYRLEDEGKTILVDPKQKHKIKVDLAQEGLPKGGSLGFDEIFNKTRLGTTDWERQIQYNQALQGELTRSIEKMEAVESARIYIVQQERTLFIDPDSEHEPSAAVFLEIKPGFDMTKAEVAGVINLISYSVKNMKPENITVVDQYGRTLSNIPLSEEEGVQEVINNQLVIQDNFQKQLQTNVQSLLEQILGPGNIAVRVNAQLNFDKKTVQKRLFEPINEETGEGIVRSIQELKEHFSGTGVDPGGIPGVDSNVPGYEQIMSSDSEQQKSEVVKNYEINEIHENLTVAPGAVNKLTVSVVVNRRLNDNEKESIALVVGNAIGYDPERDQISVEGMEFESDVAKIFADEIAREQMEKRRLRNFRIAGIALATLLAIALIRMILNRRRLALEKERLSEEMLAMQQAAAAKTRDEALEAKDNGTYAKIEKYARRKPEDVAKVLKTWLMED